MIRAAHRVLAAAGLAAALTLAVWTDSAGAAPSLPRVEARNAELLAVGVVNGGAMTLHVSRLADNAPVRDAAVSVGLRGTAHAARAEPDGGYSLASPDLELPGDAAVEIRVTRGASVSVLKGVLSVQDHRGENSGNGRQLWWWALNFGVCFGFLYLWSRRRKGARESD